MKAALPRRFDGAVSVAPTPDGGFAVHLDAKTLQTPAGAPVALPSAAAPGAPAGS